MAERQTLLAWAYHWEQQLPNRRHFTQPLGGDEVQTWTWAESMDEARRMAAHLKSLDLPPQSHIALISKNSAHWIMADLAIWMAGHVSVPLYPTLTAETVRAILDHSESKLLFVGKLDTWDDMKPGVPEGLPCIALPLSPPTDFPKWSDLVAANEPLTDTPTRTPEELGTIIYTSGSTGMPKGVMLSFGAMTVPSVEFGKLFDVQPEDRMLSYLPLAHAFERWLVEASSLVNGFELYFAESLDTFVQDLRRARPTMFISVPRLWLKFQAGVYAKMPPKKLERLLKFPIISGMVKRKVLKALGLDSVRFAGSGSAPIPGDLIAWYRRLGLELLEGYGMTENFSYSHVTRPGLVRTGYVGVPNPMVECRLSDQKEVLVKSPGTMMGYYKAEDLTKEALTEDGWLRTGDRGELDDRNRLKITGRVKELFKTSKGKYVAPVPIENLLVNHPLVEQACVTGSGFPQPHALVMLTEEARANLGNGEREEMEAALTELREEVNRTVDHHEALEFLAVVKDEWLIDNNFLTPTMKLRRANIEGHYGTFAEGWYQARKPVVWEG